MARRRQVFVLEIRVKLYDMELPELLKTVWDDYSKVLTEIDRVKGTREVIDIWVSRHDLNSNKPGTSYKL